MEYAQVKEALANFVVQRNWQVFHTPENLAKSIVVEAAELLECFQWSVPLKGRENTAGVAGEFGQDSANFAAFGAGLSAEVACFQHSEEQVEQELADVLIYAYHLCAVLGKDPQELIMQKLQLAEQKYPVSVVGED